MYTCSYAYRWLASANKPRRSNGPKKQSMRPRPSTTSKIPQGTTATLQSLTENPSGHPQDPKRILQGASSTTTSMAVTIIPMLH